MKTDRQTEGDRDKRQRETETETETERQRNVLLVGRLVPALSHAVKINKIKPHSDNLIGSLIYSTVSIGYQSTAGFNTK